MTVRERVLAGERVRVQMIREPENAGIVYLLRGQIVYEVTNGWASGVAEPICFVESDYFEERFMQNFAEQISAENRNLSQEWSKP